MRWMPLIALLSAGCFNEVIEGNGVPETETREHPEFTAIASTSIVDVTVVVGPKHHVAVHCDGNLLDDVITEVEGQTLVIRTRDRVDLRPRVACFAKVHLPWLAHIDSSGTGDIDASGTLVDFRSADTSGTGDLRMRSIDAVDVEVTSSGTGDVHLEGVVDFVRASSSGTGDLGMRELMAADARVTTSGTGDVRLTATGEVRASSSGTGDVHLWGPPARVDRSASGTGNIIVH